MSAELGKPPTYHDGSKVLKMLEAGGAWGIMGNQLIVRRTHALSFLRISRLRLDARDEVVDLLRSDGSLGAGDEQAAHEFLPVEYLGRSVRLDDEDGVFGQSFFIFFA